MYSSSDFLDLASPPPADVPRGTAVAGHVAGEATEEMIPSYDFQPIRTVRSSPPPPSDHDQLPAWGGADSTAASSSVKFSGASHEKERPAYDAATITEIDLTVKKYADLIMHAMDGVNSRLVKLENRSHHLESLVDGLKVAVGNTNGSTDGKLRQLENIFREVQTGVQVLRDKQEIADAQMQLTKLKLSKDDTQATESVNIELSDPRQQPAPSLQQSVQQPLQPTVAPPPQQLALPAPVTQNAPFHSQQNQPPAQFSDQLSQSHIPTSNSYYGPPVLSADATNQQYRIPSHQHQPPPHQHQPPPPQSYQPAPQLPQYSQPGQPQPVTPLQPQTSLPHHPEDSPYNPPPQNYPPNIRQSSHLTQPPNDPRQQFYGAANNMYEPPTSRPNPGQYPGGYAPPMPPPSYADPYSYSEPPSHYSSSPVKPSSFTSSAGASGGNSYPRLPTAHVVPQAQPSGSSGSGTDNRVPADDVVDKVSTMGFSREQVRAAVRKLTENGQSVDLNVVLDKLMNDGEVIQPQKGWFGR